MATMEQLVFGHRPDSERGREVLGSSPGISRECSEEIVRLCEGWGAVPTDGMRRPVLMSFPLMARLSALPGDLYAVIRIAAGLRPVFHVLVLSRRDYEAFDLNPFVLAQEEPFLDSWQAGLDLPRRELRPESLAPLVSPPPSDADVGFVDEAIRQMLANQRLLLPLERTSSDSERFLALVVAAMPRSLRQDLRFATWAPSGTNRFSLAATFRESALFTSWQPYLMTSVVGQLDTHCEDYLDHVRTCLRNGDLVNLEHHSRTATVDLSRAVVGTGRNRPATLTAAVSERDARRQAAARDRRRTYPPAGAAAAPGRAPARTTTITATISGHSAGAARAVKKVARPLRRRPRTRSVSRVRRVFAILLSLAIVGAGAYFFWTSGHWTRLPGFTALNVRVQTELHQGVVDIGSLYAGILAGVARGDAAGAAIADDRTRRRGLAALSDAGQLLTSQGTEFLKEVDQSLEGVTRGTREPAPAGPLHDRGRVLARELRRLALARVSLRSAIDWRDLADLDARALEARLDSLLTHQHMVGTVEPDLAAVDDLLRGVTVRTRQLGGLATLEELLAAEQWDPDWTARCLAAVDDLGAVRHGRAREWRDDAAVLARLKRAEHATDLATRAYAERYAPRGWATAAVLDVLPALQRRVHARADQTPPLLRATAGFYERLARLTGEEEISPLAYATELDELAASRALRFDPAVYGQHLARLRFLLLERLVAAGAPPDSLPQACFAGRPVQEHLDFVAVRAAAPRSAVWDSLAGTLRDPFLLRWAQHNAGATRSRERERVQAFHAAVAEIAGQRETMLRLAAAGGRCGEVWSRLARRSAELHASNAPGFPADTAAQALWQRLGSLVSALAAPPALPLAGVTVRLDAGRGDAPRDVVVEIQTGRERPWRSEPVRLGPAAPAGSGWVGTGAVAWDLPVSQGAALQVRVLDAAEGTLLASVGCAHWLADCEPADLGALDSGDGVRVSLRLQRPYWQLLELPRLL